MEELEAAGQLPSRELSERQLAIKAEFERNRGYWNSFWDDVLVLDADFFEAYTQFSSVPWKSGPLEPKVKELIYTAFDVAATHMFAPGLRAHPQRARLRRDAGGDHGGLRARQHARRTGVRARDPDPARGERGGLRMKLSASSGSATWAAGSLGG